MSNNDDLTMHERIRRGLELLSPLVTDKYMVHAEHDVLMAGPGTDDTPADVATQLLELGWHVGEDECWAIFC